MRPKMQAEETDLDDLMKTLTNNFSLLADEVQLLSDRKTILEHKLRFAHEQYQYLADRYAPADPKISNTIAKLQLPLEIKLQSSERATFVPLPSRRPAGSKQQTAEAIRDGRRAVQKIAALRCWGNVTEVSDDQSTSDTTNSAIRTLGRGTSTTTILERDFTVQGKKGELRCPFTNMTTSKPSNPTEASSRQSGSITSPTSNALKSRYQTSPSNDKDAIHRDLADPICAALYAEEHSSPPPSVTALGTKCPIRYMDQHSPEEIARYFETHKREIPRSHEICVKRYQRNEEDIRKLDAKYGSTVSMIAGLGQKHQSILAVKEKADHLEAERKASERVENWANDVRADFVEDEKMAIQSDEDREGRFDRPMNEVRVGESPSRPWGISVPFENQKGPLHSGPQQHASPPVPTKAKIIPVHLKSGEKCPFPNRETPKEGPLRDTHPQPTFLQQPDINKIANSGGPQIIFTGPVFIGYPIEQAMNLMQQWQTSMPRTERH